MKRSRQTILLTLISILSFSGLLLLNPVKTFANSEGGKPIPLIQAGDKFPMTKLVSPKEKIYREYLGLPDNPGFYLKEVHAEVIIVEFLNKYCYHCQQQAPIMNRIYKAITKDPEMKERVKILGVGVGNNRLQLEHFRREKRIRFPLIPDKDFVAFENIGRPEGTPFTVLAKKENGTFVVKGTRLGLIENSREYLDKIRQMLTGSLVEAGKKAYKSAYQTLTPGVAEEEIRAMITQRLQSEKIRVEGFSPLKIKGTQPVFMIKLKRDSGLDVWFAALGSEGKVCDICHDIHFIYLFDREGMIRDFIPIHVTKYGNKPFEEKDVEKTRKALVGKNLTQPIQYNPDTDAVSSASMTSALIFKGVKQGSKLYIQLKKEGYIQ